MATLIMTVSWLIAECWTLSASLDYLVVKTSNGKHTYQQLSTPYFITNQVHGPGKAINFDNYFCLLWVKAVVKSG